MYAITAASGRLGPLVIDALLTKHPASGIVALARDPAKLGALAGRGVTVRALDYDAPETLRPALEGVDRLLLISGSEVGRRVPQHRAVIDAAKAAGVGFVAYTSILHADRSPIALADEHRATEAALNASGLTHALLRNGWYTENFTASTKREIAQGRVIGSAGKGRISAAARADYAAAAALVLADEAVVDETYELGGDDAFTLTDYAAALAAASGKPVAYVDMSEDEYRKALEGAGLPGPVVEIYADGISRAAEDAMFDDGRALSRLLGRPTTPMWDTVKTAVGHG